MNSIKHDLILGLVVTATVFVGALVWGNPFVAAGTAASAFQAQPPQQTQPPQDQPQPDQAQPQQQPDTAQPPQEQPPQAQPDTAQSKTFTGTILKTGSQYVLRDSSGQVFKLDDPDSAKPYEGKAVKVTGKLDEQAMLIHVESIEGSES